MPGTSNELLLARNSHYKNQQALTLKLKHSDGQVGLIWTEFFIAPQVTADVKNKKT